MPAALQPPAHLKAIRELSSNPELSRWELETVAFMQPHYRTFSHFPGYFDTQGLNFQMLRQLLPDYFTRRYQLILEVGCGTGFQSLLLYVMPGFPSSAAMASFLVNDSFGVDWAQFHDAFPDNVDLPSASVDLVFSWTVLEHVPELAPMFAEMARVVRPGGLMIHVVPSVMSALDTLVQTNVAPPRRSLRGLLKRGWVIPELHSEFLRGHGYNDQLNLYVTDTFTHPMMRSGFAIERLLWLRDFNVAIVARRL